MPLFESYVFVDWSAANGRKPQTPRSDSVWVGEATPHRSHAKETYHRTRRSAFEYVYGLLVEHVQKRERVLVGFDFPYGYPAGLSNLFGDRYSDNPWYVVWSEIDSRIHDSVNDKSPKLDNVSNRFDIAGQLNAVISPNRSGPFWGCPHTYSIPHLKSKSPGFPFSLSNGTKLERLRVVEKRLGGTQESWKLYGNGSVGSQALVGIPYIKRLRDDPALKEYSAVWPFETMFTPHPAPEIGPYVLHAEIWPGVVETLVKQELTKLPHEIRDQIQVRMMCEKAAQLDRNELLSKWFDQPKNLSAEDITRCVKEEGWILGA